MGDYFPEEGVTPEPKKKTPPIIQVLKKVAETATIPVLNLKRTPRKIDSRAINTKEEKPKGYLPK